MDDLIKETRNKFSFGWTRFAGKEVERDWYKDSFSYFQYIPQELYTGSDKLGLDVGCGSGADMLKISAGGARMVGIDISDSINITRRNTKDAGRIYVTQASLFDLPFKDGAFDFAYSFGVLHHTPWPEKGFQAVCSKVKKGGYVIVYLYEDFAERTAVERFLLKAVNSLRLVTRKMPAWLLHMLCIVMSPFMLIFCCIPHQVLKRFGATKKIADRIPFRHTMRLDCIVSDLYDRFSPPIEMRYNKDQVRQWFETVGFDEIKLVNYRGWVAWGRKI
jgi:SAM-dependent methyltransferase